MDVAEAIDAESVPALLRPKADAGYNPRTGKAQTGVQPADIPIMAAIQPASGRALQDLPEGLRAEVSYIVWSRTTVALKDELIYLGAAYRIVHVWPRPQDGFNRFAIKRVE